MVALTAVKSWFDLTDLQDEIVKMGATVVGFGDVSHGLAKELRHLNRAVSIGIKHPVLRLAMVKKDGVEAYSNQFAEVDNLLEDIQKKVVRILKSENWRCLSIPPDSDKVDSRYIARLYPLFPHKTAATCAGLGWIGKNGLLITRQYGARMSWATVLTNAPIPVSNSPCFSGRCGECRRCVDICPVNAISGDNWVRSETAKPFINIKACQKQLEKNWRQLGKYICGLCIMACPRS